MLARKRSGEGLGNLGAAAGRVAVGGDGDADPGSAHGDPALRAAVGERFGHHRAEARIIDAVMTMGTEIEDLVALLAEPAREFVLEDDSAMDVG